MFGKILPGKKNRKVETSLIEEFKYPSRVFMNIEGIIESYL